MERGKWSVGARRQADVVECGEGLRGLPMGLRERQSVRGRMMSETQLEQDD